MKKLFYILSSFFVIIAVVISILFLQYNREDKSTEKANKSINKDINIALVNEDQPVKYNGKLVGLGEAFINKLSKEDTHNFETVNREIAENGMKNGTYQVMVIIPKNFSELGMQLDKKTPAKMAVQYKTAAGQNEKVTREVEQAVGTVLNSFNKNLINIYFSSIIDNLHNAQKNVLSMNEKQSKTDHMFQAYLLDPLNDYPQSFTDLMVNSIAANKTITELITGYNHSILNQDTNIFNIKSKASEIVQKQSSKYDDDLTMLERVLNEYKTQNESTDIESSIENLKSMNESYVTKSEADDKAKAEYKDAFESNLTDLKEKVEKEESPFTDEMVNDYRKKLSESLTQQLEKNPELNSVKQEIEKGNQELRSVFITNMVRTIVKAKTEEDTMFIKDLSKEDLEQAGLTAKQVAQYEKILNNVNAFKNDYNEAHKDQPIHQEAYHGELTANDTEKLVNEGVKFNRSQTVKSKDINRLTIVTDPNFNYEGTILINDKEYAIKSDEIKLETDVKSYKVSVEGVAKLKTDEKAQHAFLKDKLMNLQLVFGQATKESSNNETPSEAQIPNSQNGPEKSNQSANVVDISMSYNLAGELISPELNQQLRALDQFQSQYHLYEETKTNQIKPEIDNDAIVDMMVNEVTKDMSDFKANKKSLLDEIESMKNSSDEIVDKMMNEKDWLTNHQKETETLIKNLNEENEKLKKTPEEPKINKEEGKTFITLSTRLDEDIQKLSENSSKLLSDSKNTKTSAESVSTNINQLESNVNNLHASGRTLGTRANELNKQMITNAKENDLFAKNFEEVLKNSKDGDKQNEALKEFMSNPIKKKNLENILANHNDKHTISPSLMVLMMYLVSVMTAYLIYSYLNAKGTINFVKNEFSSHNHLWNKAINSGIITLFGLVEGLIIGLIAINRYSVLSGYRLKFMFMIIVTMIVFVLINTYLLRQVKVIGMLLILSVLGIYLVTMNQWTTSSDSKLSLSSFSPLTYIDTMFFNYLNAEHPVGTMLFFLVIFALIGLGLNAIVKKTNKVSLL
ncbi:type VII secretion protein EsaA [Staphylococcus simulans]|uniref:type VII secretion protein EsaA n=1 Tax=Staphylococcus simulans TaxID=1286 RepID=UPI000D0A5ACD|nr:type VII secretion protein EsaA [Staphylococcus simulans]AVO03102.1 type VII secretion protein EsaA [Staphylococcus simulans]AVO06057.1 type VII secretion protein EsaA [Staphylococcus simulans]AWG19650.1 type VII secretion protein EsaA [Staphylococcus simulans]AWI02599.1 type VII secretion protein EsaA [Staphylococcus simulans]